jgi:hypothetical protein
MKQTAFMKTFTVEDSAAQPVEDEIFPRILID